MAEKEIKTEILAGLQTDFTVRNQTLVTSPHPVALNREGEPIMGLYPSSFCYQHPIWNEGLVGYVASSDGENPQAIRLDLKDL